MYFFFYLAIYKYPNPLSSDWEEGSIFVFIYAATHIYTMYLFLTCGDNPGFVESDKDKLSDSADPETVEEEEEETTDGKVI
mmetsp:Transcript_39348/g.60149  ORF Transcript_39348/g.60149 Transcript_39348/m.60149 type:complete len:81 (+) Transcript_39348:77-319(+)